MQKHSSFVKFAMISLILSSSFAGCAPWNQVCRKVATTGDPPPPGDSAYIESNGTGGRPKYGCSFIEFDGKGDFLDYNQYVHAQSILKQRATQSDVLLVLYCHGWNNNSESADVVRFVGFLRHLSVAGDVQKAHLRVEGVYLAWRGSQYRRPVSDGDENSDSKLLEDFNDQKLDDSSKYGVPSLVGNLLEPLSIASYFSIKDRAELQISRLDLAQAIFGLAYAVKNPNTLKVGHNNRVFVVGHSFGALALEQTLGQASVALLNSRWGGYSEDRWPFDLIVFLNSAAPSLYAKQLQDFLTTDRSATLKPRIVSITSETDWATGLLHHCGNLPNRYLAVDLQRPYYPLGQGRPYTAGYYYDFTPGHNPLLINGQVDEDDNIPIPNPKTWLFGYNLAHSGTNGIFFAHDNKTNQIHGFRLKPGPEKMRSNYWIITVPKNIIKWHLDVWTDTSMEMMAGIYSMVEHIPATRVSYAAPGQN